MTEIGVDSLGWAWLGPVRRQAYTRYLAEEKPDGTIILTPLVRVPAVLTVPDDAGLVPETAR